MSTAPALRLEEVHKSFGQSAIICGVNLEVARGERHAIIGPNGAGKSTLFNLISGNIKATSGRIELNGRDISGLSAQKINRLGLSRSFQVTNIFPSMSVFENIRCALFWSMGYRYSFWKPCGTQQKLTEKVDDILEKINLASSRGTIAGVLSYADQRALEIGITIASGADVILLDEPMAGMNHGETDRTVELIRQVSKDKSLLMVEHDMGVVFGLADRISVLVYGKIIATDTPEKIRGNREVQEAYLGTAFHD